MKICVISDLHCKYITEINQGTNSALYSNMPRKPINRNPLASILNIIKNKSIENVDYLLCLGDLGDKADHQGIISGWASVLEIGSLLKVKEIIGIPGNHDVESRNDNVGSFDFIKSFHENFPTPNEAINNKFWTRGYAFYEDDNVIILIINTVHDHINKDKAEKASLPEKCLEEIVSDLNELSRSKLRICILHHHPIKHSNLSNVSDGDSIDNGEILIQKLSELDFKFIIHGHKHQPRFNIQYDIPILASGSFSSYANLHQLPYNPSFHVIEFYDSGHKGKIFTWEFDVKNGWSQNLNKDFPPIIGFGATVELAEIARAINDLLHIENGTLVYTRVKNKIPDIEYLAMPQLIKLSEILKNQYNILCYPEYPLIPSVFESQI